MYAAVRRFEGVTDWQKVMQSSQGRLCAPYHQPVCRDSWLHWSTPLHGDNSFDQHLLEHRRTAEEQSQPSGQESVVQEHLVPLMPNPPKSQPVRLSYTRCRRKRETQSSRARCVERAGLSGALAFPLPLSPSVAMDAVAVRTRIQRET